jgi:hypothetical protein
MVQPIDRAAFLAALQAAAQPDLQGVELPGIGACYKRRVTAGDVLDADDAREALKAAGLPLDRKTSVAIGLAQTLCDEAGRPLLDPKDPAHIRLLIALPWDTLRGVLMPGDEAAAEDAAPNA